MSKRKWLIGGVLVVVVGGLVAFNLARVGGSTTANGVPKNAPAVKTAVVKKQDMTQNVVAPGVLEATGTQEIRAPFATTRVRLVAGIGDKVKQGQVLAELVDDNQRVQVAAQEAAVARAESQLAQYHQKQKTDPLTMNQRLESARAALIQAEQGLQNALSGARQQMEQARSALLGVQNRSASVNSQVEAARTKLVEAENAYRTTPLNPAVQQAYQQARSAYESALRSATDSARQIAADLAQAQESLRMAEQKAQADGSNDPAVVQQARSTLESARQAFEAARLEAEQGGVLAEQVYAAQADLTSARESLRLAREKLAQAQLKAPFDGVILSVSIKSGQPAQENTLLFEMGLLDKLTLKARADEVDVAKVTPGLELKVKSNAFLQDRFEGRVTRVAAQSSSPAPGQGGGNYYEVQGQVENPDGKLRAGMNVEASIKTDFRTGTTVIGLESLREEGDKAFVLVVKAHKVEVRPVKLGLRTQTQVEVLEGLQEGEEVLTTPFTAVKNLKDGTVVRVENK